MKAWILSDIGRFQLQDKDRPVPGEHEVLINVKNCGICGSDIPRVYKDGAHNMPLVIGHEFAGQVAECGPDVSEKWLGKKVGIFPLIPCMECIPCTNRQYEMCKHYDYLGSRSDGGFAQYVRVPEWNLIELSDNVTYEQAAMLEPMSVAHHAISRFGEIGRDESIAIYGSGTIGLFILMHLLSMGYENISVIGNHDIQREKALKLGLKKENFCDLRNENVKEWIDSKTGGFGFDVSFEVVGNSVTYGEAVEYSAPGGRVCLVGNPHSDMALKRDTYWKILRNQLTLHGTWNSSFKGEKDDWIYVADSLKNGLIHPEELITHRYPIEEIEKGFLIMRDKTEEYIKIMCVMDG
ncbi:MAG: galactitol-1-phosphate 5-dehydrogenase [Lachnospiraceae bacterium]|nr:galactitol-1-phosphate 5-dehydrogenase [Lachnospiraceae bacterium]